MDPKSSYADKLKFLTENANAIGNALANLLKSEKVDGLNCRFHLPNDPFQVVDVDTKFGRIRFCPDNRKCVEVKVEDERKQVIAESAEALVERFRLSTSTGSIAHSKEPIPCHNIKIQECSFTASKNITGHPPTAPHFNGDLTMKLQWESNFHSDLNVPSHATISLRSTYTKMMFDLKYEDLVKLI
jgi:hypothetical protein